MTANAEAYLQSISGMGREELIAAALSLYEELESTRSQLSALQKIQTEIGIQYKQNEDELLSLRREVQILREQNQHLTGVNVLQTQELFGCSSEKTSELFNREPEEVALEDPLSENTGEAKESDASEGDRTNPNGQKTPKTPKTPKQKGKRKKDLSGLPRCLFYNYNIDELNERFGEGNWRFVFWHQSETVEYIEQTTYVKVTYTPAVSVGLEHALTTIPNESSLIPKSLVSSSLLSRILNDKFGMYLPIYRQEHDEGRFGFPISRQTMNNWVIRSGLELLLPVYEHLVSQYLLPAPYQQCDETTYTVIQDGRKAGSKSYIWIHRTSELAEGPQVIAYIFELTRSAEHLRQFYNGLNQKISLTCDAYPAYFTIENEMAGLISITNCWMHCRRGFVEAFLVAVASVGKITPAQKKVLPEWKAVELISKIYGQETPLRPLSPDERLLKRQELIQPKVQAFFDYLSSLDAKSPEYSEKFRDAIHYALNHRDTLCRFLEDGNIPIDNGASERQARVVALGRKNYLFSFSISGAIANTVISSLIQTAKLNNANSYYYIKYLLEIMSGHIYYGHPVSMDDLMPWSTAYTHYESDQKQALVDRLTLSGNERPCTPRKQQHLAG